MARAKKTGREQGFEQSIGRLERIVQELEGGDRPLEESLRLFEEGIQLTRLCAARLDEAQRRIDLLTKGEQGDLKLIPFDEPGDDPADPDDADGSDGP